jgi:hypothetical protein
MEGLSEPSAVLQWQPHFSSKLLALLLADLFVATTILELP